MEISFYLHPRLYADGSQTIYINCNYGKEPCAPPHQLNERVRVQVSTGIKVQTQTKNNWDPEKGRVKSTEKNYINKNRQLANLEAKATDTIMLFNFQHRALTKEGFKELLKKQPGEDKPREVVKDCRYYFDRWAHHNRNEVTEKHIKDTRTQLNHLEDFFPGIKPEDINEGLVSDFKEYLINKYDQLDVSLLKATNMIKRVLDEAGLKSNHKWLKRKKSGNSRGIVFDVAEQNKIRAWQPEKDERLKDRQQIKALGLAKDLLLFLIATGPRYIDLKNLDKSEVKTFSLPQGEDIKVLEYYQIKGGQKRGKPCRVVLGAEAQAIIEKYTDSAKGVKLLPVPSNQKLNPAIQEVCRLAGIDTPIKRVRYQAGKRIEDTLEKWQLASCHRCRATLATNLFEGGADAKTIQDALGHDDPKTTQIYLQNKDTRQYEDMLQAMAKLNSDR